MNTLISQFYRMSKTLVAPYAIVALCATSEAAQLPAPTLVAPISGTINVDPNTIRLEWTKVSGATGYEWRLLDNGNEIRSAILSGNQNWRNVKDLDYGKTYGWRVRAIQGVQNGKWMTTVPLFTTAFPASAELVSPLKDSQGQGNINGSKIIVQFRWKAIQGAKTYALFYATNPTGPFKKANVAEHKLDKVLNLEWNTKYYWYVQDAAFDTTYPKAQTWSFTTVGATPATLLSPANNESVFLDNVADGIIRDFSWSAVPGASSYKVRFYVIRGKWEFLSKETSVNVNSLRIFFTDSPNSQYFTLPREITKYNWEVIASTPGGDAISTRNGFYYLGNAPKGMTVSILASRVVAINNLNSITMYQCKILHDVAEFDFLAGGSVCSFNPTMNFRGHSKGFYSYYVRAVYDNTKYGDPNVKYGPWGGGEGFYYPY